MDTRSNISYSSGFNIRSTISNSSKEVDFARKQYPEHVKRRHKVIQEIRSHLCNYKDLSMEEREHKMFTRASNEGGIVSAIKCQEISTKYGERYLNIRSIMEAVEPCQLFEIIKLRKNNRKNGQKSRYQQAP